MFDGLRTHLAARRVGPGAGQPLPHVRCWHCVGSSPRSLTLGAPGGAATVHTLDDRHTDDAGSLHPVGFAVAQAHVVHDRVERPGRVGLLGHRPHAGEGGHVAHDDALVVREGVPGVSCPTLVAGVQGDGVALLDQPTGGHEAEALGAAGDEDARHVQAPVGSVASCCSSAV